MRLRDKAVLVSLRISCWTGRRRDAAVAAEVTAQKGAEDSDAGSWWTRLVPASDIRPVRQARNRLYHEFVRRSLPWMDGGVRIVPTRAWEDFTRAMRQAQAEYERAVDEFLARYPAIAAEAPRRLGKLLEGQALPSAAELRGRFGVHIDILPVPDTDDWRIALGDEQAERVRREAEDSVRRLTARAMESLWDQLEAAVGRVAKTLGQPDKVFRDSLIGNLRELCVRLGKLNLTDDEHLEQVRQRCMATLARLDPDELRKDKPSRRRASQDAESVLDAIDAARRPGQKSGANTAAEVMAVLQDYRAL